MLDIAIVGGGLCGLALAHSLQARGRDWRLFEARDRLGGRAFTARTGDGTPVDLGATWFWPHNQPAITRLVADLGLTAIDQHDDGRVLHLSDPGQPPQTVALTAQMTPAADDTVPASPGTVHGGAQRVAGGVGTIVSALARPLPVERLRLGHRLEAVLDHGDFVELRLRWGEALYSVHARRVVLALPPRVVHATVQFTPALDESLQDALHTTPTWMATAAKAGFVYARPFWREAGHTGNAWVTHPQAMLAEVFDACQPATDANAGSGAALAGFAALGAALREQFTRGRDMLLESQMVQLFGPQAADPQLLWQDWALASQTCSPVDIAEEGFTTGDHPVYGDPRLTAPHWGDRLYFGGSETSRQGGGYMEGALGAAARLRRQLATPQATGGPGVGASHGEAANDAAHDAANDAQLERFSAWVQAHRGDAIARYRDQVHQALSTQQDDQLTQRAVLATLEAFYANALAQLRELPLHTAHHVVERGRAALTPRVLAPFQGLADDLLAQALIHNRTSCALSNFPAEHQPSGSYLQTIRRDLAAAWQAFAIAANDHLLARAGVAA